MIKINNNIRIVKQDERNLVLEQLKTIESKQKGTHEEWCFCGYYNSLEQALCGVLEKRLFDSVEENESLSNIINKIEEAKKEIKEYVKGK